MEELIWDIITDKAKTRFDFAAFSKEFSAINESLADNILFQVIAGFASGQTKESIAIKLYHNMLMIGFEWKEKDIEEFLSDKKERLKHEIYITQLAGDLLNSGNDPSAVLQSVNQFLY